MSMVEGDNVGVNSRVKFLCKIISQEFLFMNTPDARSLNKTTWSTCFYNPSFIFFYTDPAPNFFIPHTYTERASGDGEHTLRE